MKGVKRKLKNIATVAMKGVSELKLTTTIIGYFYVKIL